MYKLDSLFNVLNSIAPIYLSELAQAQGDYDNSGILIRCNDNADRILFSLDLSKRAVNVAKRLKCNTIVTHHPAIYAPLKQIDYINSTSGCVEYALNKNINVISMHLNLDMADNGIDHNLASVLGGEKYRLLTNVDDTHGYGREFQLSCTFNEFIKTVKKKLCTSKIVVYGSRKSNVEKVATFCGAGGGNIEKLLSKGLDADTIVSSDIPHHVIKEVIESGKKLIIIPHYASEDYGFNVFYNEVKKKLKGCAETFYFSDSRFK